MTKRIRELRKIIEGLGLTAEHFIPTRNGHIRCYITHPDGRSLTYVTQLNGGDPRADKNLERDIARYFERGAIR